jgi:hypothetical protein
VRAFVPFAAAPLAVDTGAEFAALFTHAVDVLLAAVTLK